MAKDPVCGMPIEEPKAVAKWKYRGKTYYFCSSGCKGVFEENPDRYASAEPAEGGAGGKKV